MSYALNPEAVSTPFDDLAQVLFACVGEGRIVRLLSPGSVQAMVAAELGSANVVVKRSEMRVEDDAVVVEIVGVVRARSEREADQRAFEAARLGESRLNALDAILHASTRHGIGAAVHRFSGCRAPESGVLLFAHEMLIRDLRARELDAPRWRDKRRESLILEAIAAIEAAAPQIVLRWAARP